MSRKGEERERRRGRKPGPSRLSLVAADLRLGWFSATSGGGEGVSRVRDRNGAVFRTIFAENRWHNAESRSGPGSTVASTARFRDRIPKLLRKLGAASLLDAPCGDFNWMRHVNLSPVRYVGADIVPDLIAANRQRFASRTRTFLCLDISHDRLPRVDVILCRDCLVHMSFTDIAATFANFRRSGSTYLLTTHFTGPRDNLEIATGGWRPLNLQRPPFDLPPPLWLINEHCREAGGCYSDKHLGLWKIKDLPI